jgi:superfamily II DNA or RNA helicase
MRNYISKYTPYDNLLLFSGLGTGKTCTSITIAEGLKEYILNMGRRVVVLVKNKNIHKNFVFELLSQCTNNEYITDIERNYYFNTVPDAVRNTYDFAETRREIVNKVHRKLQQSYQFITYGSFVNRTLGAKQYEKDEYNRKTSKAVKTADGKIERKIIGDYIPNFNNTVVIVDEAHNVTNNDVYIALFNTLSRSFNYRLILLTATPMYDNPKEIFEISNLLNVGTPSLRLPVRNELFKNSDYLVKQPSPLINNSILSGGITRITDSGLVALSKSLYGKVSYIKPNTDTNPKVIVQGTELILGRKGTTNVVLCEMSDYQFSVYEQALNLDMTSTNNQSTSIDYIVDTDDSKSKASSLFKNASDASTIAFPNNMFGKDGFKSLDESQMHKTLHINTVTKYSQKLFQIITNINNTPGNVFVYSNYVNFGGTSLIKHLLLANGYEEFKNSSSKGKRFIIFDESSSIETREKYRRIFNSKSNKDGDIVKIVVGSPIMSEGITLKNVRQVHILEPSWNMSRVNQIIGRAVRNYSHDDLLPEQRTVDVFKYVSVYSESPKTFFIDKEKYILSEEKDRSNKVVEKMLKRISFDCELNRSRNFIDPSFNGLPECDYSDCQITCDVDGGKDKVVDKFTYNQYINYFEKFDIQFASDRIKELFKKFFNYHLDDIVKALTKNTPLMAKEVIYYTLNNFITKKTPLFDMYGSEGFLFVQGPFYIFNPSDLDVQSTLFAKMLDFSNNTNKYTLNEWAKKEMNMDLFEDADSTKVKSSKNEVNLSPQDIQYNDNIIATSKFFGTYRERGTIDNPYGPKDDKFRLVDLRNSSTLAQSSSSDPFEEIADDKRKIISGMWVGSFNKPALIEIINYLRIPMPTKKLDKTALGKLIENHLLQNNLVLR